MEHLIPWLTLLMVPGAGLEPARCRHRRILSPVRLPIPPPGQLNGLPCKTRTYDPLIKSQMLYH